jgi:ketosteroid isomerase-like protein
MQVPAPSGTGPDQPSGGEAAAIGSANAEYVRGWVEDWNHGDVDALLEEVDPNIEWVVAREHPAATTHRGPGEIGAYLADWLRTMPGLKVEIEEIEEAGDRVLLVMRMRGTGAGSGADVEVRLANVTTFRNGKPVRVEEYLDPDEGRQALKAA